MTDMPKGIALLHDPVLNKGTAFTDVEREALGLRGLLPPRILSAEEQVSKIVENFQRKPNNIEKYVFLIGLQDRNETLFYRVVLDNLEQMMPILYTPTVGQACQEYGHIFRRPRGLYVSEADRGRIPRLLANWPNRDVRVIVITDGERILGLGDLGANGMGIPVGKLALYTACGGVPPSVCLPVTLDVGTNNESLLKDPLYIGLRQKRVRGEAYESLVEEFVRSVQTAFPKALIQLEDFGTANAFRLLNKYRQRACIFDDDIQGTASVTLGGIYSALRITRRRLADQKFLFLGSGEAGIGIADLIVSALMREGVPEKAAREKCWFVDSTGLVVKSREGLADHKRPYAHEHPFVRDFLSAVETLKPTAIIGVSGVGNTFTKGVVEAMTRFNERPIIFALSNPTAKSECTPVQAYTWSNGRAIFACGSPFEPVTLNNQTFVPGQGNNSYIFPGVGLGVVASEARRVVDKMFFQAAQSLANEVSQDDLARGSVYPPLKRIREVTLAIATAVAKVAYAEDLAGRPEPADIRESIHSFMYQPVYRSYV